MLWEFDKGGNMPDKFPVFRSRSAERDKHSDTRRRHQVRENIAHALADAEREIAGLQGRVDAAYQHAVGVMDNSGDYESRAAADEHQIVRFESEAAAALYGA